MANKREKRFKVKGTKYDHKRSDGIDRWRAREIKLKRQEDRGAIRAFGPER